ncbi:MAG: hypothetical protein ACOYXM_00535 [Actinomycetota bacterium]
MAIRERTSGRSSQADLLALFSVLWALAAAWHLLGNTTTAPAWAQAVLTIGIALALVRPGAVLPLAVLAAGGLITMWEEAPLLGNHWLLAGFVNVAILLAVGVGVARGRAGDRADLAHRLFPVARLCLVGFYMFAAFSKLNSAFFDRSVSCAVFFFRESTDSLGLGAVQLDGASWLEWVVIIGTVAIELAIPVLLVVQRTRHAGVVLGLVFHAVLALDRTHQFFDFSAVLYALFVLFLPTSAGTWVAERIGSIRARLALRGEGLAERVHLGLVAVPTVLSLLVVLDVATLDRGADIGWWPWQGSAVLVIGMTGAFLRQNGSPEPRYLRPHHLAFAVVPLLVVLNGLTPYLELKTGYGWNMYSNLRTVDGDSNHLLVRRTLPLTDEQSDLVEILSTSSPGLRHYAQADYALTWRQLRQFLAVHPDVRISYRRGGRTVSLERASDDPELVDAAPEWREKVQLFRAIDLREPERCVPAFGPAR